MNTAPSRRGPPIEITQAEYYTSALYPEPLTPEYINQGKMHRTPKRGTCPPPYNQWTPMDLWYNMNNNWFHAYNDKFQYALFGANLFNQLQTDFQPVKDSCWYSPKVYDDDIFGQTAGGIIVGAQLGCAFGMVHTFNLASEANIFQSASMPPNRWLPLHKANWRFKARIFGTCIMQSTTFFATYCFVDAAYSQLRQRDDVLNPIVAGICSGVSLAAWFKNYFYTIPLGCSFGIAMAWMRFCVVPEDTPKLCLDFDRPFYGVFGGMPMWFAAEEPNPDRAWYAWWGYKYRKWV